LIAHFCFWLMLLVHFIACFCYLFVFVAHFYYLLLLFASFVFATCFGRLLQLFTLIVCFNKIWFVVVIACCQTMM
jgi:hypothetical protein